MSSAPLDSPASPSAAAPATPAGHDARREALALLASIFVVAACGLVYELLIASVASYLQGSSVTQFSISVGLFIGSMGIGSWLSQRIRRSLLALFFGLELLLGFVGGASATLLFWSYAWGYYYLVVLYGSLILIGTLVGLELPLLVRLLASYGQLRTIVANALSFDYLGCLVGALAFPLVLLPALGLTATGFLVGLVNIGVGLYTLRVFRRRLRGWAPVLACTSLALLLGLGLINATRLSALLERQLYDDEIIHTRQTPYQRIVLTRWRNDLRLYLDGNLQFSTVDEHRYHETLVHPAMGLAASRRRVLVLGGGDGLGVREVLRHQDVEEVTLVDLDPQMTALARRSPPIVALNGGSLSAPRVRLVHDDAQRYLERTPGLWDVIVADLPDPNNDALARLYSREFYRLARRRLARGGVFVTQGTSPLFSRESFWCIVGSLREAGFSVLPTRAYVPSFGEWGFVIGADRKLSLTGVRLPPGLRFLTPEGLPALTLFDPDESEVPVEASTLDHPRILEYYLRNARAWD